MISQREKKFVYQYPNSDPCGFDFQILSDEEKKRNFDMFGTTSQPGNGGPQGKPFYDPHSGFSFFFNGMPFQNSWSKPGQINYRFYYKTVLPESYEKPYLIEIISDWCFACKLIIRSWYNIWHISMTCCGKNSLQRISLCDVKDFLD